MLRRSSSTLAALFMGALSLVTSAACQPAGPAAAPTAPPAAATAVVQAGATVAAVAPTAAAAAAPAATAVAQAAPTAAAAAASAATAVVKPAARPSGDPIKIGAILGISGRFSFVGGDQQNALKMAEDEINGAGGIAGRPLQTVIYDDEVDDKKSGPLANRLIFEDKAVAIIGPSITLPSQVVAPIAEKAKIPAIVLTSKAVWEEGPMKYVYHTTPREEIEVASVLDFVKNTLGKTRIAVLYDKQPYGAGNFAFIEKLKGQFGVEVVGSETVNDTDTDVLPQLTRLKNTTAEALVVWVGDPAASTAVKQTKQLSWSVPVVGSSAIAGPRFLELAGAAAEGVYTDAVLNYEKPEGVQKRYLDAYKARYGTDSSQFGAFAYDAIYLLKQAIEKSGGKTDGDSIVAGINSLGTFDGVTARYQYSDADHNGLGFRPIFIFQQVKDGKWVFSPKKGG